MQSEQLNVGDYFNLPNPGLRAYFAHVERGNSEVYRPPFWKGVAPNQVISNLKKLIDTSNVKAKWPELYEYEMEQLGKIGPMSIQKPLSERLGDVKDYYTFGAIEGEPLDEMAIQVTLDEFKQIKGIRPRSYSSTVADMRLSTNSGNPYFAKRDSVKDKTLPLTVGSDFQELKGRRWPLTAVLGWRGQEGGPTVEDTKQRVVFMMPFGVNIAELAVYQPFITGVQRHNLIPAYVSMNAVDDAVTQLFDTKDSDDLVVCTDFSKFDQHFNYSLQNAARSLISGLLTPGNDQWLEEVFPIKYNIPLTLNESVIYSGHHGMGSGSGGTNADETLVHRAMQHEAALADGAKLNIHSQCLGDDGILSWPGITVDKVMQSYTRHGLEMNETKQYESTHDCVYLRRWHSLDYRVDNTLVGVYPISRALGRLLYQERFYDPDKWNAQMVTLRAWSILENCKFNPLFREFVNFVLEGDRYKLGLLIPGFMDDIERISNKAIDDFPDMLGYTKNLQRGNRKDLGIKGWAIYKLLSSMN